MTHALLAKVDFFTPRPLSEDIGSNIDSLLQDPQGIVRRRMHCLEYWLLRSERRQKARVEWAARLPPKVQPVLGKIHFPLLEEMLKSAGHNDVHFVEDLQRGFPVSGPIRAGGVGRPCADGCLVHGRPAKGACPDLAELYDHCEDINMATLARIRPGKFASEVWGKHKKEMSEGKVGPSIPVDQLDLRDKLLLERFGVEELREGQQKVRVIDNFRKNHVNGYASLWE